LVVVGVVGVVVVLVVFVVVVPAVVVGVVCTVTVGVVTGGFESLPPTARTIRIRIAISATTATTARFYGTAGRTYCFSVRARDAAGNVGLWGTQSCVAFPVDERTMTAAGTWSKLSSSLYFDSTAMSSTSAGATLELSVAYRRLYVIATTCSGC